MLRCLGAEFLSLSVSCVAISSICVAPFSSTSSTQADNNSRKLRFRFGCVAVARFLGVPSPLQLGTISDYKATQITRTHTSIPSLLQSRLVVAWLQTSNNGYSSCSYGSRTQFSLETEEKESGEIVRDTVFWGQETTFPVLKVPRQCPLVLLVQVMHMMGINFLYIAWKYFFSNPLS
jgi:hypothetical protein